MVHRLRVSILAAVLMCFGAPAAAGVLTVAYTVSGGEFVLDGDSLTITDGLIRVRFGDPSTPLATASWTYGEVLTWRLTVSPNRVFSLAAPLEFSFVSGTYDPASTSGSIFGLYVEPGALLASGGTLTSVSIDDFGVFDGTYTPEFAKFSGATPNGLSFSLFGLEVDEVDRLPEPTGGILLASGAVALLGLAALRRRSVGRAR